MAIATLMRINEIFFKLQDAALLVTNEGGNKSEALSIKITLAKQLYIQSVPLLNEKDEARLKPLMMALKVRKIVTKGEPSKRKTILVYDEAMDKQVDDFIIDVQNALQGEGYFMPPKNDLTRLMSRE